MRHTSAKGVTPLTIEARPRVETIGLSDIFALARRRLWSFILPILALLTLAAFYIAVAPPKYAATADLLVDTQRIDVFSGGDVLNEAIINNAAVETQVEILRSGSVAEAVVNKLDLAQDPNFLNKEIGFRDVLKNLAQPVVQYFAPPEEPISQEAQLRKALRIIDRNLEVSRVGLSYVLRITYNSSDPVRAADIANAVTDAYLIERTANQEAAVAKATAWLEERIDELRRQAADTTIPSAERAAMRITYENLLSRYAEATKQGALTQPTARVITEASPATGRGGPKPLMIIVTALLLGSVAGLGTGLLRDLLDRKVYTLQQLEHAAGFFSLGVLPRFTMRSKDRRRPRRMWRESDGSSVRQVSEWAEYSVSVDAPFSLFTETLRSVRVAARADDIRQASTIGVTSTIENEGKTTVSANLARLVAHGGVATLLIDGDLRRASLSGKLVPTGSPGLIQVLSKGTDVEDLIWSDPSGKLSFLPAGSHDWTLNGSEMLNSDAMKQFLESTKAKYSFVVMDLPPLLPVVDVRSAAPLLDGLVFVVEWGRTTEDLISQALRHPETEGRFIGAVLNKVNLRKLRRILPGAAPRASLLYNERYGFVS